MNLTPEQIKKIQDEEKNTPKVVSEVKINQLADDLENFDGLFSSKTSIAKALLTKYTITTK